MDSERMKGCKDIILCVCVCVCVCMRVSWGGEALVGREEAGRLEIYFGSIFTKQGIPSLAT